MFLVFRNSKAVKSINNRADTLSVLGTVGFESYEKARQGLRKYIRSLKKRGKLEGVSVGYMGSAHWDGISRNPTRYTDAGFTIRQVA
jgi:hypothetical protein